MKHFLRRPLAIVLAVVLCCLAMIPALLPASADEATSQVGTLTGEVSRESQEILLADGTHTGVIWSKITLDGFYGSKVVNVAEFSLANTHLSLEVINSGKTIVASNTTDKAASSYNANHEGQTVLAAINGDLWMTKVHSGSEVTTSVLKTTRGVLIMDGEIWATQQIDMENYAATNAEKGGAAGDKAAFGVTDKNQPLVGSPDIRLTISVNDQEIAADGLNRLPCWDSLIVYNHRVNSSNYALDDSYEVEIEVDDTSAFRVGNTITGKVVATYSPGCSERPSLSSPKTIVLTARGKKAAILEDNFTEGDTVSFDVTLTDRWGNTELWQNVQEAIGGHMQVLLNGKQAVANGDKSEYPTTLIGYRDDGSVLLLNVTSTQEKKYAGLKFNQAYQFCREMGYNSVFYLDGGGSSTFVSLEEGTYTIRNNCSDGSPRIVINSVGVVWNDTPVCSRQGSLQHIDVPLDMSEIPPTYMDGAMLTEIVGAPNALDLGYDAEEKAFTMTTNTQTADPYATLSFTSLQETDAARYPYMVFKLKTDHKSTTNFKLYYAAGSVTGATESCTKTFQVSPGDDWQYLVVDMGSASGWKGTLHNIRLDIFDGTGTSAGVTMSIGAIVLCENLQDAQNVANGWIPEGAITDFLAYKEAHKVVHTEPPTEEPPTEAPTEEPPTEAPTDQPTETPEVTSAEAPTEVYSEELTELPTEEITDAPTESATAPAAATPSAGAPTEPRTEAPAVPTVAVTDAATQGSTASTASSGCRSTLSLSALFSLLALAAISMRKSRK